MNPACAVYDSSLFYTLKPSSQFVFRNYEFADTFYTNKMGLRDDDNSLLRPEIICIGDSHTMGWGVPQNETFAEILSQGLQKKVLNAGIASYGTIRELKNLYRLDTSGLQNLIIQYNPGDAIENLQFIQQGYSLKISSEKKYDSASAIHYWTKLWFPGKHFMTISKLYVRSKLPAFSSKKKTNKNNTAISLHKSAVNFANIMLYSAINFNKTRVFVVNINEGNSINDNFSNEVKNLINSSPYKEHFNDNLILVPLSNTLNESDFYILDDHMRRSGHEKVAKRLLSYILQEN
jgi:hypothetical protein